MRGKRWTLVTIGLVVVSLAVSAASATLAAGRLGPASGAPADCSHATAVQLVNENDLNLFLLPDPVAQVLCGPFTGPGSQAMAVTIYAETCWRIQHWAVFELTGGSWKLVLDEPAFLIPPLLAVGADIKETTPVFGSTDPRCVPSGGTHARIWHWDGTRFVAGSWKQLTAGKPRTFASFYSPSRNISCEMDDGRPQVGSFVLCQSVAHAHSVRMGLDGRLKTCRGPTRCLGNPGEHTPVLGYGKQIALSHFRCRSRQAGVTCTVIRTGKGFRIDRAGVRRVGP